MKFKKSVIPSASCSCVLPEHPPTNSILLIISLSAISSFISIEQTPFGLNLKFITISPFCRMAAARTACILYIAFQCQKSACVYVYKKTAVKTAVLNNCNLIYLALFAFSTKAVNAAGSAIAISESIFLLISMLAFLRPSINVE